MGSTLQPNILYTDTVVPGTALSKSLYSKNLLLSDEELFNEEDNVNILWTLLFILLEKRILI